MRLQAEKAADGDGPRMRGGCLLSRRFTPWGIRTKTVGDQFDHSRKECNAGRYQQLRRDPACEEHWSGAAQKFGCDVAKARTVRHTLCHLNGEIRG